MKRVVTRVLMLAVIGVAVWGSAGRPSTRTTDDVPERVRGTWRLADAAAAPEGAVRAFRLEATRVVPLNPAGLELRAYPVLEVATTTGRERIWKGGPRLHFGPRIDRIQVYFGRPHPTVVAEQVLDVEPLGEGRVRARHEYPFGPSGRAADRWPDDASEYVRAASANASPRRRSRGPSSRNGPPFGRGSEVSRGSSRRAAGRAPARARPLAN